MTVLMIMMTVLIFYDDNIDGGYDKINLGLMGELGGDTERRGPGRDPAGEGGS